VAYHKGKYDYHHIATGTSLDEAIPFQQLQEYQENLQSIPVNIDHIPISGRALVHAEGLDYFQDALLEVEGVEVKASYPCVHKLPTHMDAQVCAVLLHALVILSIRLNRFPYGLRNESMAE